jgi:uncharacterized protein
MDVGTEIATLRKWLREDTTRLQSPPSRSAGSVVGEECASAEHNFNQHGDWHDNNNPNTPWTNFPNWTNSTEG